MADESLRRRTAARRGDRWRHHRPGRRPCPAPSGADDADHRAGGHGQPWAARCRPGPFAGLPSVECGADMFLARTPAAVDLATDLGLAGELVAPVALPAYVWSAGRLHALPEGLVLGAPTRLWPLATSGLLSWRGKARAALEPVMPRHDDGDSVGAVVRGAIRGRGARTAGRATDRGHQRRRSRPAQPRRGDTTAGRSHGRPAQPPARAAGPGSGGRARRPAGLAVPRATLRREHDRASAVRRDRRGRRDHSARDPHEGTVAARPTGAGP